MIIKLTNRKQTIVDLKDYYNLIKHKWYCSSNNYAVRVDKDNRTIYIAREIIKPEGNLFIDHINRDTLDNRRKNLRLCTSSQNQCNRVSNINTTSKYKGVTWHKRNKRWQVMISGIYVGCYKDEIEAAIIYDTIAKRIFGNFARLNLG